jgi:hypothetical protein
MVGRRDAIIPGLTIVSHRRPSRTRDRRENYNNKHCCGGDAIRVRHHGDGDVRRMYIIIWYAHIVWYKAHDNCTRTTRTRYYNTYYYYYYNIVYLAISFRTLYYVMYKRVRLHIILYSPMVGSLESGTQHTTIIYQHLSLITIIIMVLYEQ